MKRMLVLIAAVPCLAQAQALVTEHAPGGDKDAVCAQAGINRIAKSLPGG